MKIAPRLLAKFSSVYAKDVTAIAPSAWYTTRIAKQKTRELVNDRKLTPLLSALGSPDSDSDEALGMGKDKKPGKKSVRQKLTLFSSVEDTGSCKRSVKQTIKLPKLSTLSSNPKQMAPKLKVSHTVKSRSPNVVNYRTYCPLDKSQTYSGKIAARTGKYSKHIETLMKSYKFDSNKPITFLDFVAQFKGVRNSNRAFESVASWNMSTFTRDKPAFSSRAQSTSDKDDDVTHRLQNTYGERTFLYVEAVSFCRNLMPRNPVLRQQRHI